ncbi:MAG: response regulator [Firmicutes bacterium]|nr:response regulator [Bacillota bacterium]
MHDADKKENEPIKPLDGKSENIQSGSGKTILVVEDEFHIREIVRLNLEMEGYKVLYAENGKEALDIIASGEMPDLVVTDIMMAQMDGLELFLNLKEKPATSRIPVIVLTVKSQFEDIRSANLLGVDEYMTKPFDPRDLNFKIKELLKNR